MTDQDHPAVEPTEYYALHIADLMKEWRRTCKTVGVRCTDDDMAAFVAEWVVERVREQAAVRS